MRLHITVNWLEERGACKYQVERFSETFPNGVDVSLKSLRKAAKAGLDLNWFAEEILLPSAWKVYKQARNRAFRAYSQAEVHALDLYNQTETQAMEVYRQDIAQALEAYGQAKAQALLDALCQAV